jgi:hypothetical protein
VNNRWRDHPAWKADPMSDHPSDSWLDAQLRETPLPEALIERLRAIAREKVINGHLR